MPGGRDSDGEGSEGMVDEQTREAQAGETGTTRLGTNEEGADTDGAGSGGMVEKQDPGQPLRSWEQAEREGDGE